MYFKKTWLAILIGSLAVASVQADEPTTVQKTDTQAPAYQYSGAVKLIQTADTGDGAKLPDPELRIVAATERHKDIALLALGALMGSFRLAVSKEDYKGETIATVIHPADRNLNLGLQPIVDSWVQKNAEGRTFKNPLWTRLDRFQLVYRGTDEKPDYFDLKIQATLGRKLDSGNFLLSPKTFTCTWVDDKSKTTLADWQANDYAKVRQAGEEFVADCLKTAEKNLPTLLAP